MLFTFPSRYWFTIGHHRYVALEDGPPRFPRGFPCPVVLRNTSESSVPFAYWTVTVYGGPFQGLLLGDEIDHSLRAHAALADRSYNPNGA